MKKKRTGGACQDSTACRPLLNSSDFFFGKDNPCPCGLITCDLDETGVGETFHPWERSKNDGEDAGNQSTSAGDAVSRDAAAAAADESDRPGPAGRTMAHGQVTRSRARGRSSNHSARSGVHAKPVESADRVYPAASVKGVKGQVMEGKTPDITIEQARTLLAAATHDMVGLRDRAILATLAYTACRGGAVARLRPGDFQHDGQQYVLRFQEKGAKSREIPVRHDLEGFILAYVEAAGIGGDAKESPLFWMGNGRTRKVSGTGIRSAEPYGPPRPRMPPDRGGAPPGSLRPGRGHARQHQLFPRPARVATQSVRAWACYSISPALVPGATAHVSRRDERSVHCRRGASPVVNARVSPVHSYRRLARRGVSGAGRRNPRCRRRRLGLRSRAAFSPTAELDGDVAHSAAASASSRDDTGGRAPGAPRS